MTHATSVVKVLLLQISKTDIPLSLPFLDIFLGGCTTFLCLLYRNLSIKDEAGNFQYLHANLSIN